MQLDFRKFEIKKIQAPNFIMSPLELKDYISFEPKRVYFISKPTGNTGQHCHLKEEELFIMAAGTCTMIIDRGNGKEDIKLQSPADAVYVGPYVWHGFKDISPDAIILAVSSTNYSANREDYIEDYDHYKDVINKL
ncbi:FdtA/QdtA family cupin domain-containing protein [Patescibacteria group bacterium]|nr:FdtA/QdtA family cupin domain-containing protein [Patescibacteria group bacterium]